jgi:hypothetical protein
MVSECTLGRSGSICLADLERDDHPVDTVMIPVDIALISTLSLQSILYNGREES